jgi:predicted nucleic acid-binding protein
MPLTLLDTNVLVHATYRGASHHAAAADLLDRALRKGGYCIAPQVLVEFAAVVTRRRFVDPPLPAADVLRIGEQLYSSRRLKKVYPSRGTVIRAIREGASSGITGAAWYDLYLAVTMRDAGVHLIVTENIDDFRRFGFVTPIAIKDALLGR